MRDYDFEALKGALQAIIEYEGDFENPASQGITRLILDSQYMPDLSDKQQYVFVEHIEPCLNKTCARCGDMVPYEEIASYLFEGVCGYCAHMTSK